MFLVLRHLINFLFKGPFGYETVYQHILCCPMRESLSVACASTAGSTINHNESQGWQPSVLSSATALIDRINILTCFLFWKASPFHPSSVAPHPHAKTAASCQKPPPLSGQYFAHLLVLRKNQHLLIVLANEDSNSSNISVYRQRTGRPPFQNCDLSIDVPPCYSAHQLVEVITKSQPSVVKARRQVFQERCLDLAPELF